MSCEFCGPHHSQLILCTWAPYVACIVRMKTYIS